MQQRAVTGALHIRRVVGAAVTFLFNGGDLQFRGFERGWREFDNFNRVDRDLERADANIRRRCRVAGHTAADQIFDRRAQRRQGFVERRRFHVVARIEAQRSLAGSQQNQAATEGAVEQAIAQIGAHDIEPEHHPGAANVLEDLAPFAGERFEPGTRACAGPLHLLEIQLVE